jgi:2-oxoglutarate ferredoxin oxidoreductase subunit alpha
MSNGQMLEDVQLSVLGKSTVGFYNRMGGVVPATDEIIQQVKTNLIV